MTLQLALGGGVASRSAIPDILTPARAIQNQTFRRPRSAAAGSSGAPHFVVTRLAARECYFYADVDPVLARQQDFVYAQDASRRIGSLSPLTSTHCLSIQNCGPRRLVAFERLP